MTWWQEFWVAFGIGIVATLLVIAAARAVVWAIRRRRRAKSLAAWGELFGVQRKRGEGLEAYADRMLHFIQRPFTRTEYEASRARLLNELPVHVVRKRPEAAERERSRSRDR